MLQEVEQCASLLTKKNSQEIRTLGLIKLWEQRYQATQVFKAFCELLIITVKYLYDISLWVLIFIFNHLGRVTLQQRLFFKGSSI